MSEIPDDTDPDDPFHPQAEPLVPGKTNLHQIRAWVDVMERVNDHYDPDGGMYPTPADHIIHHARELGVPDMPAADSPGAAPSPRTARRTWPGIPAATPRRSRPDRSAPTATDLPLRTVGAFHRARERLDIPRS